MPHGILTGEIHLACMPILCNEMHSPPLSGMERLIDLSFFITQKAIDHRIGVNLYCNLTEEGLIRYPLKNYTRECYLPYEILDNPLSNECFDLFRDSAYLEEGFTLVNTANTGLHRVQDFFEDVLQDERIEYLTLRMEDVHGVAKKTYEYETTAGTLCQAIEQVPNDINRLEIPAVRFKIVRGK